MIICVGQEVDYKRANVLENKQKLTKSQRKKTVRYLAMKILVDVEQNGSYVNQQLSHVLDTHDLAIKDAHLLTELVYGVTQRRLTLDYVIELYIKKNIPVWLRNVLRIAVFQMFYLERIPMHAILYEAAEITRIKAGQSIVNFVNAVLRNVQKNGQERLDALLSGPDTVEKVSIMTSLPMWLMTYFLKRLSLEEVKKLGLSLLEKPALSVRAYDRDVVLDSLSKQFQCEKGTLSPFAIRVLSGQVAQTELFKTGQLTIQDETSMLVAPAGQLKPSDVVLDACAAPGGKTTHIAHYLNAEQGGKVYALDIHEHKQQLIRDNAKRLHVSDVVETQTLDARNVHQQFPKEFFDVAFVDAPCSGLGLMRRKPDIKYTKILDTVNQLVEIQSDILESVAPCVKDSGKLVYSTCTLTQEENIRTIQKFIDKHPEFSVTSLEWMGLPENCYTDQGAIEVFPDMYHTDGFFICTLEKNKK